MSHAAIRSTAAPDAVAVHGCDHRLAGLARARLTDPGSADVPQVAWFRAAAPGGPGTLGSSRGSPPSP